MSELWLHYNVQIYYCWHSDSTERDLTNEHSPTSVLNHYNNYLASHISPHNSSMVTNFKQLKCSAIIISVEDELQFFVYNCVLHSYTAI